MNEFIKRSWVIALALTATAPSVHADQSQQVQTCLSELNSDYQGMTNMAPISDEDGASIVLACDQLVFISWADAYLQVLDKTPSLDQNAIGEPLFDFGKKYFQAKGDLPVFDMGRKGLIDTVMAELPKARLAAKIGDVDPTKMSISDIQENLFEQNINICNQPDFVNQVAALAPAGDPNAQLPASVFDGDTYQVDWVKSPDGGIEPVQDYGNGSGGCPGGNGSCLAGETGPAPRAVGNFQQFLNDLHENKNIVPDFVR